MGQSIQISMQILKSVAQETAELGVLSNKKYFKKFRHWLNHPYPLPSPSMVQSIQFFLYRRLTPPFNEVQSLLLFSYRILTSPFWTKFSHYHFVLYTWIIKNRPKYDFIYQYPSFLGAVQVYLNHILSSAWLLPLPITFHELLFKISQTFIFYFSNIDTFVSLW